MAGEVSKQDEALTRAAGLVAQARQELDAQCKQLRNKLQGIGGQWQGAGAVAFTQVMERWDADTRKVVSALDNFEANLKKSEATYAAEDAAQQQTFNRLSSRLG